MRSLSELGKIDLLVLFVGGAALAIGSLLLLEIALCDLTGLYEPQSNRDRGKSSIPKPRVIEPPFTKLAAFRTFKWRGLCKGIEPFTGAVEHLTDANAMPAALVKRADLMGFLEGSP